MGGIGGIGGNSESISEKMSDVKKTATVMAASTSISQADNDFSIQYAAKLEEIKKLKEEINIITVKGEKVDSKLNDTLLKQQEELEDIKDIHQSTLGFLRQVQAFALNTNKSFDKALKIKTKTIKQDLKAAKENKEGLKRQKSLLKGDEQGLKLIEKKLKAETKKERLAQKQLKSAKDVTKLESKRKTRIGETSGTTASNLVKSSFNQALASPLGIAKLANSAATAGLTTGLSALGGKIGGEKGAKTGGILGGAFGGLVDVIIDMITWQTQWAMKTAQTKLVLDTASGGKSTGMRNVLDNNTALDSSEFMNMITAYAKSGFRGKSITGNYKGYMTGEAATGLEKASGSVQGTQDLLKNMSPIYEGKLGDALSQAIPMFLRIQDAVKDTGISAQIIYEQMGAITEQAQYANISFKFVEATLTEMVNKQKQYATIGLNVQKDGGKTIGNIISSISGMSTAALAGYSEYSGMSKGVNKGLTPYELEMKANYGKDWSKNITYDKGKLNIQKQSDELDSSAMSERIIMFKESFREMTTGMDLTGKSKKSQEEQGIAFGPILNKLVKDFGLRDKKTGFTMLNADQNKLSEMERKAIDRGSKTIPENIDKNVELIAKGLTEGKLFSKLEELAKTGIYKVLTGVLNALINMPQAIAVLMPFSKYSEEQQTKYMEEYKKSSIGLMFTGMDKLKEVVPNLNTGDLRYINPGEGKGSVKQNITDTLTNTEIPGTVNWFKKLGDSLIQNFKGSFKNEIKIELDGKALDAKIDARLKHNINNASPITK